MVAAHEGTPDKFVGAFVALGEDRRFGGVALRLRLRGWRRCTPNFSSCGAELSSQPAESPQIRTLGAPLASSRKSKPGQGT